jgi:hypothetical protein
MKPNTNLKFWILGMLGCLIVVSSTVAGQPRSGRNPSRILYVDAYLGDDDYDGLSPHWPYASIQRAVSAAGTHDTIFVYDGIYRETVDIGGKALTIKGIAGPLGVPVIEEPNQAAILMVSGEGPDTVLQNLIVRNSLIGICTLDSSPTLRNLTVVECGIGLVALNQSEPRINSCIFWHNTLRGLSGAQALYSCVQEDENTLLSNISQDPLFVDFANGDYHLQSTEGRYVTDWDIWTVDMAMSPCINTGDPERDFGLEPASNGERINMGAYGGTSYASLSSNLSPTVRIKTSSKSSGVGGVFISISAEAQDPDGDVIKIEFYANGIKMAEDKNGADGWSAQWQTEKGTYLIVLVAEDNKGARVLSEAMVLDAS